MSAVLIEMATRFYKVWEPLETNWPVACKLSNTKERIIFGALGWQAEELVCAIHNLKWTRPLILYLSLEMIT